MSYELVYNGSGFVVCFKGDVTIDELNDANGEMHGHSEFDRHSYQIVDLLDADLSSVTEEDAEFPARADGVASETRWGVKVAFVVQESHSLDIVNKYVEHAREFVPRWEFGVFSANADALNWAKGLITA